MNEDYALLNQKELDLRLLSACIKGDLELVEYLTSSPNLNVHAQVGNELNLIMAASNGHLEVIKYLLNSPKLKEHADIHADDEGCFVNACMNGRLDIVKYLLTSEELKEYPTNLSRGFKEAIKANKTEVVEYLILEYGLEKNKEIERYLLIHPNEIIEKLFSTKQLSDSLEHNNKKKNKLKI